MINLRHNFKIIKGLIPVLGITLFMLSACSKNQGNEVVPTQPLAAVTVIDASPDAAGVDFYLNSNRVNASSLTLGTFINYFNASPGKSIVDFYQEGTIAPALQDTIVFVANHNYSLFIANTIAKPDYILLNDSLNKPAGGTVSIRIVNVSPDAGAVDLVLKSTQVKIAQNEIYKKASAFTSLTVSTTDTLQIRQAGTSTVLASVPTTNFLNGSLYSVLLYGFANTSVAAQKLNAGIMANGYFK